MQEYTLTRTGKPPLSFEGELVAESLGGLMGKPADKPPWKRHHNIRIYRTAAGAYVLEVAYCCMATSVKKRAEPGHSMAMLFSSPQDVADLLGEMSELQDSGRCAATLPMYPGLRVPSVEEMREIDEGPRRPWESTTVMHSGEVRQLEFARERFMQQVSVVLASPVFAERAE